MKVKDFINFLWQVNEQDNCICNIDDIYITIMRKKSLNNYDIVMQNVLISTDNLDFFNDCEVMLITKYEGKCKHSESYTTLKIVIYKEEENNDN